MRQWIDRLRRHRVPQSYTLTDVGRRRFTTDTGLTTRDPRRLGSRTLVLRASTVVSERGFTRELRRCLAKCGADPDIIVSGPNTMRAFLDDHERQRGFTAVLFVDRGFAVCTAFLEGELVGWQQFPEGVETIVQRARQRCPHLSDDDVARWRYPSAFRNDHVDPRTALALNALHDETEQLAYRLTPWLRRELARVERESGFCVQQVRVASDEATVTARVVGACPDAGRPNGWRALGVRQDSQDYTVRPASAWRLRALLKEAHDSLVESDAIFTVRPRSMTETLMSALRRGARASLPFLKRVPHWFGPAGVLRRCARAWPLAVAGSRHLTRRDVLGGKWGIELK